MVYVHFTIMYKHSYNYVMEVVPELNYVFN